MHKRISVGKETSAAGLLLPMKVSTYTTAYQQKEIEKYIQMF